MTDLEAHVIVTHMSLLLRRKMKDFARTGRLTKSHQGEFLARGLIRVDEYGGLVFTDTGSAALKYIDTI